MRLDTLEYAKCLRVRYLLPVTQTPWSVHHSEIRSWADLGGSDVYNIVTILSWKDMLCINGRLVIELFLKSASNLLFQVENMTKKWHVYMTKDGRISLAGLNKARAGYLADAMIDSFDNF